MTEPVPVAEEAARNQRALQILAGVVGVLLVGFLATRLLGGGGDDTVDPAPVAPVPNGQAAPPPGTPPTTAPPLESFEVFTTKNPFVPLRSENTGGGAPGGGVPPLGGTPPISPGTTIGGPVNSPTTTRPGQTTPTTTRPGQTTPTTSGGSTTPTTGGASGGTATEPRRGDRVTLQDVFLDGTVLTANVRVNDTVYRVTEGQTFATSYRVVSLDQQTRCGRFIFGDDQFRLCRGEEVVK